MAAGRVESVLGQAACGFRLRGTPGEQVLQYLPQELAPTAQGGVAARELDPHQARREPEQRLLSFHTPGTQHRDALTVEIHR
ncbi:hypothetical protein [Streptomyces torulosus]|uniref:hypothetical protein n=1 Tax=Streptomyces torulosus TaxID=68276 RepID=UPI0012FF0C84|nr:hypothetical protein [Streptomyces torulosus]